MKERSILSAIETRGVMYFTELFLNTKRLDPEIPIGDKGRITDGHVNVFKSVHNQQTDHSLKDGDFLGRLQVQVKGQLFPKNKNYIKSYPLAKHQLENIQKIGGVVLFVAGLPRDNEGDKIAYYADLAVENAEGFLNQMGKYQSSISIPLKLFPTDPQEVYRHIRHFQKRQSARNIITPDDKIMKNATGFTITLPHPIDFREPQVFGDPTSSAIIEVNGPGEQTQAINAVFQITPEDYLLRERQSLTVSCGDISYLSTRWRRIASDIIEHHISPGICVTFNSAGTVRSFSLHYQTFVHFILKDLLFIEALQNGLPFLINNKEVFKIDSPDSDLDHFLEPLNYLNELIKMCDIFGVDPKLCRLADISEYAAESLKKICACLFHNAAFENRQGIPLRHEIDLGNYKLQLLWVFDQTADRWVPTNFFDTTNHVFAAVNGDLNGEQNNYVGVTPYDFFRKGELGTILNLCPESLVSSYQNLSGEDALIHANQTVLNLIESADQHQNRRVELLSMASDLNSWTIEKDESSLHYAINRFQIRKRLGEFTDADQIEVRRIWEKAEGKQFGDDSLRIEAAASILLDRAEGITYLLGKMTASERDYFKSFPIYFLHENRERPYIIGTPNNDEDWARVEAKIMAEQTDQMLHPVRHS